MKANELMIGDWVEYGQYITTVRQLSDKIILSGCIGRLDEVRPVLLTPEILEKNGFERDQEDGTMCFVPNEIEEVTWRGTILKIDSLAATLEHASCMYVHQLQHALKLCGIGKEINL